MSTFLDHYKAIKIKTGVKALGIIGTLDKWEAELPNGEKIDELQITPEDIAAAKIIRQSEEAELAAEKAAKKAAVLTKLGLTSDEVAALLG